MAPWEFSRSYAINHGSNRQATARSREYQRSYCDPGRPGAQYDVAADYRLVELYLLEFIEYFKPVAARREMTEVRLRLRAPSAVPTPCQLRTPYLFINENPVLKLSIHNIPIRLTKSQVLKYLTGKGYADTTVESVHTRNVPSVTVVICKNLLTSIKLQVDAIKNELVYETRAGKRVPLRVKPDEIIIAGVQQGTYSVSRPCVPLTQGIARVPTLTLVLEKITFYLSTIDVINLYEVSSDFRTNFENTRTLRFNYAIPRYSGQDALQIAVKDAQRFRFRSLEFLVTINSVSGTFVKTILDSQVRMLKKMESSGKFHLEKVGFDGVEVDTTVHQVLKTNYNVKSLMISNTTQIPVD